MGFIGRCRAKQWIGVIVVFYLNGCATTLPIEGTITEQGGAIAVGPVVVVITGKTKRIYEPAVRSFELFHRQTGERFQVEVQSDDLQFTLALPSGEYELSRVQINEGPFMSMAQLSTDFVLGERSITYLGTWRFGVDSPRYGRMVVLSVIADEHGLQEATDLIKVTYPAYEGEPILTVLPSPAESESRLYEVMSYPRIPRYFQRHQW